jgi:hypothetical protein
MEQWVINLGELKSFVARHKLQDHHSIIQFNSIVSLDTEKNSIRNKKIVIMITFNDFDSPGRLFFMRDDLDPYLYSTVFDANWQQMQHIDNEYLLITGNHTKNPDIGEYRVKVIPLDRLRE